MKRSFTARQDLVLFARMMDITTQDDAIELAFKIVLHAAAVTPRRPGIKTSY